jgi:hypothetical protein
MTLIIGMVSPSFIATVSDLVGMMVRNGDLPPLDRQEKK